MAPRTIPRSEPIHFRDRAERDQERLLCGARMFDEDEPCFTLRPERVTCVACLDLLGQDDTDPGVEVLDRDGRVVKASKRVEKAARGVKRAASVIGEVAHAADTAKAVLGELSGAGPIVKRKAASTIRECGGALEIAIGIFGGSDEKKRAIEAEIKKKFGLG